MSLSPLLEAEPVIQVHAFAAMAAFVLGIVVRNVSNPGLGLAIPTGITGLVSLVVGLYAQMISATREERILIVTGMVAGFVGLAIGLADGAFGG